ncbi:50S ribosomal protein L18a [Candidatus Bathyarchaeota archaeon]|nr:50S ribosomal protein L18a [Candidatus Bathyarchaeota archaeon]
MSEVRVFRIIGEIRKPNWQTPFEKEVIAIKPEHAVEKIYMELGSKHRVKRFQIKINEVKEIAHNQVEDPLIRKLLSGEDKIGE